MLTLPIVVALLSISGANAAGENEKNKNDLLLNRLTLGGYGEAVYTRNFYSDNMRHPAYRNQLASAVLVDHKCQCRMYLQKVYLVKRGKEGL